MIIEQIYTGCLVQGAYQFSFHKLTTKENFYIYCATGFRSVIAASILKSRGFHNFYDVKGGIAAMKDSKIELSDYICSSTL